VVDRVRYVDLYASVSSGHLGLAGGWWSAWSAAVLDLAAFPLFLLYFASNIFQRCPSRILNRLRARALFQVQIPTTMRAQPLAIFTTDCLHGHRQQHLLAQHIFQK